MKAVGVHTLALVFMIIIFAFAAIAVFGGWLGIFEKQVTAASCTKKIIDYCSEWLINNFEAGKEPQWTPLEGCQQPTAPQCKNIL